MWRKGAGSKIESVEPSEDDVLHLFGALGNRFHETVFLTGPTNST